MVFHTSDEDVHRLVGDKLGGDRLHLPRPGGAEEESLALLGDGADDLLDLRLKAHVQHPIGLIQNKVGDLLETDLTSLEKVVEPPRGGNDNLDPIAQVAELRALWSAPVQAPVVL